MSKRTAQEQFDVLQRAVDNLIQVVSQTSGFNRLSAWVNRHPRKSIALALALNLPLLAALTLTEMAR